MCPRCGHELYVILQKAARVVPAAVQRTGISDRQANVRPKCGQELNITLEEAGRDESAAVGAQLFQVGSRRRVIGQIAR